jgi:hybrid cluster-associated redox disulfide protein
MLWGYLGGMDAMLNQTTTIETVFNTVPNASRVFLKHKTICVGCPLARFCTLSEMATIYELNLQSFLNDLQHALNQ